MRLNSKIEYQPIEYTNINNILILDDVIKDDLMKHAGDKIKDICMKLNVSEEHGQLILFVVCYINASEQCYTKKELKTNEIYKKMKKEYVNIKKYSNERDKELREQIEWFKKQTKKIKKMNGKIK